MVIPATIETGAAFSECGMYRYALWRIWDADAPAVLFVGLNPSTADATRDDPTLRRCIGFARAWGFGGVRVANLFAFRATDPRQMRSTPAPVGPENDHWLSRMSDGAGLIVAAWGNHGGYQSRDRAVLALLPASCHLGLTRCGQPRHPLYVPADTPYRLWTTKGE